MPRDGRCWFHCYNATEYLELWRAKPRKETGYACAPDDIIAEEAAVASLVDFVSQEGATDPDPKARIRAEEIAGGDIVGLDGMPWLDDMRGLKACHGWMTCREWVRCDDRMPCRDWVACND